MSALERTGDATIYILNIHFYAVARFIKKQGQSGTLVYNSVDYAT